MNERIKELAVQSGLLFKLGRTVSVDEHGTHSIEELNVYDTFDYEKFAELIIKECSRIAYDEGEQARRTGRSARYRACTDVAKQLKEHFGVKE